MQTHARPAVASGARGVPIVAESADKATHVLLKLSALAAVLSITLAFVFRSAMPLCLFAPFAVLLVFELARWITKWQAFETLDNNAAAKTQSAAQAPPRSCPSPAGRQPGGRRVQPSGRAERGLAHRHWGGVGSRGNP